MRKLKRIMLILMTLLLCTTGFSMNIYADNDFDEEKTYTAVYEFVEENNEDLPEEVTKLLPNQLSNLIPGQTVTNKPLNDIETEESVFSFVSWNYDEYTIKDADITFTGVWRKTEKEPEKEIAEEPVPEIQNDDFLSEKKAEEETPSIETYKVSIPE